MLKLTGTINLPYNTYRKSEYTGDLIYTDVDTDVVKAKLTIDDEGNVLYWAWKPAYDPEGTERTKPTRKTHKIKIDLDKTHTSAWTIEHANEDWKSLYWYGKGGYSGSKYELTTIKISTCDDFETVYVLACYEHKRFGYRGEKPEMRTVDDYGIINVDKPEELLKLWKENRS